MNITEIINKAIKDMNIEQIIIEKTQESIKETLESIIRDTFKSYSNFGKELEKKVSEELKINLDEIKLDEYNQIIISLFRQSLKENSTNNLYLKEKIDDLVKELTQTEIKQEYKLSEIVELYKEEFSEDAQEDEIEEMYLNVVIESNFWTRIYLNKKEVNHKHEAEVQFSVDHKTGRIEHLNLEGDMIKGRAIYKNRVYGVDKLLYQIYLVGAKIIVDEKDCDLYYQYED